jgi:peptidoglycan/xylan/chitin deacetylase (PgdA/CDA1 family)
MSTTQKIATTGVSDVAAVDAPTWPENQQKRVWQTSDNLIEYEFLRIEGHEGDPEVIASSNGEADLPATLAGRVSKRHLAAKALDGSGLGAVLRRLPAWRGVLILNYHRIGYPNWADLDRNLWSATPEAFDAQMAVLQRDCDVIGLADLEQALGNRRGRSVMITFDDGYLDNYTRAFKILRDHGLTATFFVTTGFLDRRLVPWWDEIAWMVRNSRVDHLPASEWSETPISTSLAHWESAIARLLKIYKGLKSSQTERFLNYLAEELQSGRCPVDVGRDLWMTWDMAREMQAAGMTLGGHSVTHPVLSSLSPDEQDYEVGESRRRLVAELGSSIEAFSYPVGGGKSFNEITKQAVRRHGFRWGFTYLGGYLQPGDFDPFALRRTAIETDIDLPLFRSMIALPQLFA